MTLSPSTIETVKSTVPVLRENAETITTTMYDILFDKYPETKNFFGDAPEDQPEVFAATIHVFAMNIDNIGALRSAIDRMSSAHVRTNVRPEHYPMVGDSFITAMTQVLGNAATPRILKAWSEAYFFLSDVLIAQEKEMYGY